MKLAMQFSGTTCSRTRSLAYNSSQFILCHLQLPEIITGRAIEQRIAIVKACGNNVERNHHCRYQHEQRTNVVMHDLIVAICLMLR